MSRDSTLGSVHEPLTGRLPDRAEILGRWRERVAFFRRSRLVDEIPRRSRGRVNRASVAAPRADLAPLDPRRIGGESPRGGDS
ncbi:MAG: hypothetical protein ACM3SU_13520 [Acidobacteriota bacterium]